MLENSKNTAKINEYLRYLKNVRHLSDRACTSYGVDFKTFVNFWNREQEFETIARDAKPEDAMKKHLQHFISDMTLNDLSSRTINHALSALRGFYKYLVRFNYRIDNPLETQRGLRCENHLPVFLWENEMADFARLPQNEKLFWMERDKALILTLYSSGLRISEAMSLSFKNCASDFSYAKIRGKGGKDRTVFFSEEAQKSILEYLPKRKEQLIKSKKRTKSREVDINMDALFITMRGGRPLGVRGAEFIIERYAEQSKLKKNVHPHSFRHSFATHLTNHGCDIRLVQELLGHKNLSTTQIYMHTNLQKLKDVYKKAHPHAKRGAHD